MEEKKDGTRLEEIFLERIIRILESLPNKGDDINLSYILKECKKIEVNSSTV